MSRPWWEIVHTDTGYHIRFVASNGKVIVWSETYKRRRTATNALYLVADSGGGHVAVDERTTR
jgi:uncharacterized protein YegP (UPF0339 family)